MSSGFRTIIHPVKDLAKAKAIFTELLGVKPVHDQPYYVGFEVAGQEIGLDPNGHDKGMTGPVGYAHVDDIAGRLKALVEAGAEVRQDIKDIGGGRLIATVTDTDGNVLGLLQPA